MSYPILYNANDRNFEHLGVSVLSDAIKCHVSREENGIYILELDYRVGGKDFDKIKIGMQLLADAGHRAKRQRFKVVKITHNIDNTMSVYCKHISQVETSKNMLKKTVTVKGSATTALQEWRQNLVENSEQFTVWSDISAQKTTTWKVEEIQNAREALGGAKGSILDVWGGQFEFDNLDIKLHQKMGRDTSVLIAYGRNLKDFEQEQEITDTVTSIYPFVKFQENDTETVITLPEHVVDSNHVSKLGRLIRKVDFSSDESIKTVDQLREATRRYIRDNSIGVPKSKMKISYVDLSTALSVFGKTAIEEIDLCDTVRVEYSELGIVNENAKVVKVVWDVLNDENYEIEIGDSRSNFTDALGIDSAVNNAVGDIVNSIEDEFDRKVEELQANADKRFKEQTKKLEDAVNKGVEDAKASAEEYKNNLTLEINNKIAQATAPFQNQINQLTTTVADDIKSGLNGIQQDLNGMRLAYSNPFREDNNLIPNFAKFNDAEWGDTTRFKYEYIEDLTSVGGYTLKITCIDQGKRLGGPFVSITPFLSEDKNVGKKYTMSYDIKSDSPTEKDIFFSSGERDEVEITTDWKRIEKTFTNGTSRYNLLNIYGIRKKGFWTTGDVIYIRDFKLEEGEKATPLKVGIGAYLNLDNNGFVTKAGKIIDGNTIASMLTVQPDAIRAVTEKMVLMGPIDNLVDMNGRDGIISDVRDVYVTDYFTDKLENGDEFIFEADVTKLVQNGNYDLNTLINVVYEDGENEFFFPNLARKDIPLNKKTVAKGSLRVPLKKRVAKYRFGLQQDAYSNFDKWRVDNLVIRRKKSADLIVDGSITSRHLMSESIESGHLKAGIINSNHISTDAIEAKHLKVDQAMINELNVNSMLAKKIISDSAFINRLNAITIDASKITGGKLRANVQLEIGGSGYMRPYGQAVQFVIPEWNGAGHGVGMHFKGNHGGVGKGLTIYNLNNVSSPENPAINYAETLLTVHGGIEGGFMMKNSIKNTFESLKGLAVMSNRVTNQPMFPVGFDGTAEFHRISWIGILNHNGNLSLAVTNGHNYYRIGGLTQI